MELSFSELKKRDVVNISDGKCYGKMTDLTLSFPRGTLAGITVPGNKKNCIARLFDRSKIYIEEKKIVRIGSDVILVDLKCGEVCDPNVKPQKIKPAPPPFPPVPPCQPCGNQDADFGSGEDFEEY